MPKKSACTQAGTTRACATRGLHARRRAACRARTLRRSFFGEADGSALERVLTGAGRVQPHSSFSADQSLIRQSMSHAKRFVHQSAAIAVQTSDTGQAKLLQPSSNLGARDSL